MDKDLILQTLNRLPEDAWMKGAMTKDGSYCAVGWLIHEAGLDPVPSFVPDAVLWDFYQLTSTWSNAFIELNDMSATRAEAIELITETMAESLETLPPSHKG